MYWNYRVIEKEECGETEKSICEVYYHDTGDVSDWSGHVRARIYDDDSWEDWLKKVAGATKKPVLIERIVNGRRCLVEK